MSGQARLVYAKKTQSAAFLPREGEPTETAAREIRLPVQWIESNFINLPLFGLLFCL